MESALLALDDANYYLTKAGRHEDAHAVQRMIVDAADECDRLTDELNQSWADQSDDTAQELQSFEFYCKAAGITYKPEDYE